MKCMTTLFISLILLQTVNTADAGIIASFTADGSAFMPLAIDVGQFVDVPLYLRQTMPNTEFTTGLLTAGVGVSFAPTGIANASFLSYGSGWDNTFSTATIDNTGGFASLQTTVDFFDPAVTDGGTNAILLGILRFTGVAAGSTVLTLTDAVFGFDDTVGDDGLATVLDDVIQFGGTAGITVNGGAAAVPEPATRILFLLGAGFLAWHRLRHKASHS